MAKDMWKHELEHVAQQAFEARKQRAVEQHHHEYLTRALKLIKRQVVIGRVITANIMLSGILLLSIAWIIITNTLPNIGLILFFTSFTIFVVSKGVTDTKRMHFWVMGTCIKWLVREVKDAHTMDALIKVIGERRDKWNIDVVIHEHLLFWSLGGYYTMSSNQLAGLKQTSR
jgi:hypothetical protein